MSDIVNVFLVILLFLLLILRGVKIHHVLSEKSCWSNSLLQQQFFASTQAVTTTMSHGLVLKSFIIG